MQDMETTWSTCRQQVVAATRALSSVCDGAHQRDGSGFNGADSGIGNDLARLPEQHWSPTQVRLAYRLLAKYARQLSALGIDYAAIPTPPADDPSWSRSQRRSEHAVVRQAWSVIDRAERDEPAEERPTVRGILGPDGVLARRRPGYEPRAPQLAMAELVEQALADDEHAVIEAGTGTGKSYAYLIPVVLSGKKAIVSTADKSLQEQLVRKDVPTLQELLPVPFSAALLKGRGNYLCLHALDRTRSQADGETGSLPGMAAEPTFRSPEAAEQWPRIVEYAATTDSGDLDALDWRLAPELREQVTVDSGECLGKKCPQRSACFAEKAKEKAKRAQVVIVNHALLLRDLALRAATEGHATVLPDADIVVLDEAHHLQDVATDAFGIEVSRGRWPRLERQVRKLTVEHLAVQGKRSVRLPSGKLSGPEEAATWQEQAARYLPLLDAVSAALNELFAAIEARFDAQRPERTKRLGDDRELVRPAVEAIGALSREMASGEPFWLTEDAEREQWAKRVDQLEQLADNLTTLAGHSADGEAYVRYAELARVNNQPRLTLLAKPISVAPWLRRHLWNAKMKRAAARDLDDQDDDDNASDVERITAIATSATIAAGTDLTFWREQVGLDAARELVVGSPFDYRRNGLLYLPRDGRAFDPTLSRDARDGSSRDYLERMTAEIERLLLASDGRAFVLFTSYRTMLDVYDSLLPRLRRWTTLLQGDLPRPELVKRFKEDGRAILFGTRSFWEGVDVQGEALSLVIIDKLPFNVPDDPVWEARCDAINRQTGDRWAWFNRLAIPTVQIALKQGVGRLIRSRTDRGVVAILDGRMTTKPYGERITRSLPPMTVTRSLDAVSAFFGGR